MVSKIARIFICYPKNFHSYCIPPCSGLCMAYLLTHYGEEMSPESHDASLGFAGIEMTAKTIGAYVKGVATSPSVVESCMYTVQ